MAELVDRLGPRSCLRPEDYRPGYRGEQEGPNQSLFYAAARGNVGRSPGA